MTEKRIKELETFKVKDLPKLCYEAKKIFDKRQAGEEAHYTDEQKIAVASLALITQEKHMQRSGAAAYVLGAMLALSHPITLADGEEPDGVLGFGGEEDVERLLSLPEEFFDLINASVKWAYIQNEIDKITGEEK